MSLGSVGVYCGSTPGTRPAYLAAADLTGRVLARRGLDVVYGGGRAGLMGALADGALAEGGHVVGVIPRDLVDRELAHQGVSELHVVDTMHERKLLMAERSDAFLALPGGAGTLEEVAEQWTWTQLTIHDKRSGLLDVDGFWEPLREMLETMIAAGFVRESQRGILAFDDDVERLLDRLAEPPDWTDKWGGPLPHRASGG